MEKELKGFFMEADVIEDKKMIRDAMDSLYYSHDLTDAETVEEFVYKPDALKNIMGDDWDYAKNVGSAGIEYPLLPPYDESIDSMTITQCVNKKTGEGFLLEGAVNEDGSKEKLYIVGLINKDTACKLATFLDELPLHELGFKITDKTLEKMFNEKDVRKVADLTPDVNSKSVVRGRV